MVNDEWWTQAVEEFGLDHYLDAPPVAVSAEPEATAEAPRRSRRRRRSFLVDWLIVAVLALGLAWILRLFVVQQLAVEGQSMLGTLHSGDRVVVNKLSYRLHDPRRGDIVVLKDIKANIEVRDLIKRVVGVPGETVEYRRCELFINGDRVDEPYLDATVVGPQRCGNSQPMVTVEPGHVFVMGDNRGASLDSRSEIIGQVSYDNLIGRAFVVVWPTADWTWL
jgi:signal peptidase I